MNGDAGDQAARISAAALEGTSARMAFANGQSLTIDASKLVIRDGRHGVAAARSVDAIADGQAVGVVNVGNQRHAGLPDDLGQGRCCFLVRYGDANDVDADILRGMNLFDRGGDVVGLGLGHRLHGNQVVAANGRLANHHGASLAALNLKAHVRPRIR